MEAPSVGSPDGEDDDLLRAYAWLYTELGYLPVPEGIDAETWFKALNDVRLKRERKVVFGDAE